MKLVFACPSYGPMEPAVVIGQRLAIMYATKYHGVEWVADASPNDVKLSTIDSARNRIVKDALEMDADAILWCDSDVVLPQHAIGALVGAQKDFISGIYHQRGTPFLPVIARYDATNGPHGNMGFYVSWPENVVMAIDACGFGIVLTSLAMFRTIPPPWFAFTHFSEDFTFCLKAKAAGYQLHVHTAVQCGHMGQKHTITVDDFKAAIATSPVAVRDESSSAA